MGNNVSSSPPPSDDLNCAGSIRSVRTTTLTSDVSSSSSGITTTTTTPSSPSNGGIVNKDTSSSKAKNSISSKSLLLKKNGTKGKQQQIPVFAPGPSPIPDNPSPAMRTALQWVAAKNRHDIMRLYCVTEVDATFYFPDADMTMPMRAFWDAVIDIFEGFPDLSFSYDTIEEIRPGVIRLTNYVGAGHHTGNVAFGDLPVLQPTGKFVADEPIELTLEVNKNGTKISHMIADAKGGLVGPPGFYAKAKQHIVNNSKAEKQRRRSSTNSNKKQ